MILLDAVLTIVVAFCAVLAYANVVHGEFVFDDLLIVQMCRHAKRTQTGASFRDLCAQFKNNRSLLHWTFKRDAVIHGWDPAGWHWFNIAVHAVNSATMFAILRYYVEPWAALAGALVFTLHPMATASVASVSGRSSSLCAMFYFLAVLAFLCGWWLLILPLGLFALRSKEEAVMLPITLLIIGWWG